MGIGVTGSVKRFFALRVPNSEFENRPWRIHEVLDEGFRVEDVWACPTPGGPDDLATFVRYVASPENATLQTSPMVRWLFSLRWRIGKMLGWDKEEQQVGKRVASLRDNLPADLLDQRGPDMALAPFKSVFLTHDEWTAEFSASMGHIVMHHGWVLGEDGKHYSQMTSLVKPYGVFGKAYMAAIQPFRYLVVYPLQFRVMRKVWPDVLRDWSQPRTGSEESEGK
ncbi:DUF2867 domain-containing protein [Saccharothrix sp. NRRL B-16314]|uniref:DUF2867 domain-containing protein n=1 Tax=Saccharothrix sp. NRRL B-16314 TaxID=1463825 RepID=UPI0007C4DD43|nr:DUF2867 domain-containing protein [Saccharothrix sp. NRRL B-16314]